MTESGRWADEAEVSGNPVALDLMTAFVLAQLGRPLTVAEIADAGDCSPTTAQRIFARYTGMSIGAWVRTQRMREAALLLSTSGLRVGEVALRVGYPDPLHFSRAFAKFHHIPPSRYAAGLLRP